MHRKTLCRRQATQSSTTASNHPRHPKQATDRQLATCCSRPVSQWRSPNSCSPNKHHAQMGPADRPHALRAGDTCRHRSLGTKPKNAAPRASTAKRAGAGPAAPGRARACGAAPARAAPASRGWCRSGLRWPRWPRWTPRRWGSGAPAPPPPTPAHTCMQSEQSRAAAVQIGLDG
jgi:hypothetical protein